MIDLKLAEYDLETGKFKRFLKLGERFVYCNDWIGVLDNESKLDIATQMCMAGDIGEINPIKHFHKDKTDPLNRFDGLFNGRTYGGGKFVLMRSRYDKYEDFVYSIPRPGWQGSNAEDSYLIKPLDDNLIYFNTDGFFDIIEEKDPDCLGNLHQNPKLYKKIEFI